MTEADQNPNQFTVEYLVIEPGEGGAQHREQSPSLATTPSMPTPTPTTTSAASPEPVELTIPHTADSTLDADHNNSLVAKYRRMEDLVGEDKPSGLAVHELKEEVAKLHAISVDELNSFAEAEKNP